MDFYDKKTKKLYRLKWVIEGYDAYIFAENKKCYNRHTGQEIPCKLKKYTKGYHLASKFVSQKKLRELLKIVIT